MRGARLSTVGAVCAILTTVTFLVGGICLGTSAGQDLIPPTGADGVEWISDVDDASGLFFVGAWLIILTTLVGSVALVGLWDVLREAGRVLMLAPILGVAGLVLVTISHLIPIALAYEFPPGYMAADEATRASLGVTFDTLANLALILNYTGNGLGFGVALPLFAVAILTTRALPRWIGWLGLFAAVVGGWLGLFAAVVGGWLGLLGAASDVIEGISAFGFIAFFVFMVSAGIAILVRQRRPAVG